MSVASSSCSSYWNDYPAWIIASSTLAIVVVGRPLILANVDFGIYLGMRVLLEDVY